MNGHTNGPWVGFADQGNTIAIIPAGRDGDICKFAAPFPIEADADLMIAAPRLFAALDKINDIRNSIIGTQTINWSEHIYPLVAALDEAGFEGQTYPEARTYVGSLIDRANKAEAALKEIAMQLKTDEMDEEGDLEGGYDAIIEVARVATSAL